mmetsp:Transcript_129402/g.374773  ORF Transcript_129402/g.374773 Transcript_129402/m.374773 type:complete len:97 (-) Transcript_129402:346-636(-)
MAAAASLMPASTSVGLASAASALLQADRADRGERNSAREQLEAVAALSSPRPRSESGATSEVPMDHQEEATEEAPECRRRRWRRCVGLEPSNAAPR